MNRAPALQQRSSPKVAAAALGCLPTRLVHPRQPGSHTMPLLYPNRTIADALGSGKAEDIEAAFQWLALADDKAGLIEAMKTAATTTNVDHHAAEAKLRFVQLALARGANPNSTCEVNGLRPETATKEMTTLSIVSTKAAYFSPRVIDLLIKRGARVDCTQSKITNSTYDRTAIYRCSPLACAILYAPSFKTQHVAVAHALLRGGATLDSAAMIAVEDVGGANSRSESIEWVLQKRERRTPSLANNPKYLALKAFLLSVRAAGDYRSFVIEQRRTCALVRHLALRDRATTRDGVLKFLARTGERGLFRLVLSYLSPPPPQPTTDLTIRVRMVATGEQTFFKMKSTIKLMKVFRAYATRIFPFPVARLAFSLPGSEVLIEGCQTCDDIGLGDGGVIDAMLLADHPLGLQEQASAAAAAADAAR